MIYCNRKLSLSLTRSRSLITMMTYMYLAVFINGFSVGKQGRGQGSVFINVHKKRYKQLLFLNHDQPVLQ